MLQKIDFLAVTCGLKTYLFSLLGSRDQSTASTVNLLIIKNTSAVTNIEYS